MSPAEFLQLPVTVKIGVGLLLWPAIWAGAYMTVALAGDLIRQTRKQRSAHVESAVMLQRTMK